MTDTERKAAARQFAADWQGRGDEKQETQSFWLALLRNVYGVANPEKFIDFEVRVKLVTFPISLMVISLKLIVL